MAQTLLTAATVSLAGRSAELSNDLYSVQDTCAHETSTSDISAIAAELTLLSTTLWRLHEAIADDPDQYTQSFNQDLAEIIKELKMVFEEITECSAELQKADSKDNSKVGWLFKKNRARVLQKHLAALKTTLLVMRTVLWHGREYGASDNSPALAESQPHTMHEDRVIIESVLAQNRDAIIDLHNIEHGCQRSPSQKENHQSCHQAAETHSHSASSSGSVEYPPIPDILSPSSPTATAAGSPTRHKFSKRGVRLGVHAALLDMGAHDASDRLKEKWIQTSRSHQNHPRQRKSRVSANFSGQGRHLAKISEADSVSTAMFVKNGRPALDDLTNITDDSTVVESPTKSDAGHTPGRMGHKKSLSKNLHKVMGKLGMGGRRSMDADGSDKENEGV